MIVASGSAAGELISAATGVLGALREVRLRGDCLLCVAGCDGLAGAELGALLELASATGTAVVLTRARPGQELPGTLTVAPAARRYATDPMAASLPADSPRVADPSVAR